MTVGVGPWVCTLPCGSAQLCLPCPILVSQPRSSPNLMFPWPVVQCIALVHCLCARCLGALPVCTAWVHCPCALPGCTARVHCLGAACARGLWALPVRVACAYGLWTLPVRPACGRCLWELHGRCACVRCLCTQPGHCLCTQPGHSQPDHGIAPMITNQCVQALNAPCPKSVSAAFIVLSVLRLCCLPSEPTSESHIRSHM